MKSFRLWSALLFCVAAAPAFAQPAKQQAAGAQGLGAVHDEMVRYGQWLVRLNATAAPANEELQNIQAEWQKAMALPSPTAAAAYFRPVIARTKARIAEARKLVQTLETPSFPALDLPADVQPAALIEQMRKVYDRSDDLLDSFGPVLDAMVSGNLKAVENSGLQMLDAAQVLVDTQAILANAGLATVERDSGAYELQLFQVRFFQSAGRMVGGAKQVLFGKQDPGLAADLEKFASQIDAIALEGRARVNAKTAEWEALIAGAGGPNSSDATRVLHKSVVVLRIERRLLDDAGIYTAALRTGAAKARTGKMAPADIMQLLQQFRAVRDSILAVSDEESRALAGIDAGA